MIDNVVCVASLLSLSLSSREMMYSLETMVGTSEALLSIILGLRLYNRPPVHVF
jgi:hypothetical protein